MEGTEMKEITPSSLPKLEACALFDGKEGASAAAERGTAIDIVIRRVVEYHEEPDFWLPEHSQWIERIPVQSAMLFAGESVKVDLSADIAVIHWGAQKLRDLSDGAKVETREPYLAMHVEGLSKVGTADAVCPDMLWVADIKTGAMRDYRNQLAAYSLACMDKYNKTFWTAHVLYVDHMTERTYTFTYDTAKQIVDGLIAKATAKDAQPTPCEFCSWCRHFNGCSAIVKQAEEAVALVTSANGNSVEKIKAEITADKNTFAAFLKQWKLVEKEIAEPLFAELKERLGNGEDFDGWKLSSIQGRTYVEAAAIAKAAVGIDPSTLICAMGGKMSGTAYLDFCAKNGIEPDGDAVKTGAPSLMLRQTKKK
jgi:hypothetical protein